MRSWTSWSARSTQSRFIPRHWCKRLAYSASVHDTGAMAIPNAGSKQQPQSRRSIPTSCPQDPREQKVPPQNPECPVQPKEGRSTKGGEAPIHRDLFGNSNNLRGMGWLVCDSHLLCFSLMGGDKRHRLSLPTETGTSQPRLTGHGPGGAGAQQVRTVGTELSAGC